MTLAQVDGAVAAIAREERKSLRNALIAARGAQAKPSDFKSLMRQLEKD